MHKEFIPNNQAIWQSDTAKTYRCPVCKKNVFTQYEMDDLPVITCQWPDGHLVQWGDKPAA